MLAGAFLLIRLQTELFGSYYVIIPVFVKSFKMTSSQTSSKPTAIVMSNRVSLVFGNFLFTELLFPQVGLTTVWLSVANALRLLNKRLYSLVGMRTDDKQKSHNVTLSNKYQKLDYIAIRNR